MKAINFYDNVTLLDCLVLQALWGYERRIGSISRMTRAGTEASEQAFALMYRELIHYIIGHGYSEDYQADREATAEIIGKHYTSWIKRYKMKLTKAKAVKSFMGVQHLHSDDLKYPLSKTDKASNREMWDTWTDSLFKAGEITEHQYNTWTYPRNSYFY